MRRNTVLVLLSMLLVALIVAACGAAPTPTAIPSPTRTALPTFTPAPTRTPTPKFSPTPTVTNTPVSTATPTTAPTNTPKPTDTPRPPTNTPKPAPPPPPPTNTPIPAPPTNTPLPAKQWSAILFGTEPNCGNSWIDGTVYDANSQQKPGVVIWLSDASGNYRDGFMTTNDGTGATGGQKTPGFYSITIGPGMRAGKWFAVVVDSKAAVKAGSQQELSDRFFFDIDGDPTTCKPGGGGRQHWIIDFKANY